MNLEKWVNILVGSLIVIMVLVFSIKYFFDASEKIVLKDPYKKSMKLGIYIKKGNYKGIEDLLKSKMDVNYPTTNPKDYNEYDEDPFPVTPLLIACKKGDLRSVKLLLENGAVTSIVKGTKWSPLHESLWWGYHENDYEIVKLLIQHGSDVNLVEDGTRPLTIVSWKEVGNGKNDYDEERAKGILRIFKLLEKSGAIPNVQSDYGTVLSNASFNGNLLLVKYLLDEKGLDINSPDNLGRTALWYSSSKKSNVKIVEYLLSKGADKNIKFNGKTPLENAKENKCGEIVKILSK